MKKVIVAGHICIDVTPIIDGKNYEQVSDILKPGKLVQVGAADVHTGGAVANTGLAMKILGADVSLMGKVSDDAFGDMILGILRKYDADKDMIISKGEDSSYSVVLAIPGIDRIFLHNPGTNNTFVAKDVDDNALREASLIHFGYPPLMEKMFEDGGYELVKLMKKAIEYNTSTSLDMAAIDPTTKAGAQDWDLILRSVLPYVDFFVPSVEELCFMLDRDRFDEWQHRAGDKDIAEILDPECDIKPLAYKCIEYGAKVVIVKAGAPGMYYATCNNENISGLCDRLGLDIDDIANRCGFQPSFVPEKIVSGTGAGDTSIAAFLTAIINGENFDMSLKLSAATGACCVEGVDALSGLKSLDELKTKIANGWEYNGGLKC